MLCTLKREHRGGPPPVGVKGAELPIGGGGGGQMAENDFRHFQTIKTGSP